MARTRYRKPKLPRGAERLLFVDEHGVEDGAYPVSGFSTADDGAVVCSTHGRTLILRVTRQQGDTIWTEDGAGQTLKLRIVPLPAGAWTG